jgi:hypothetical protein
VPLEEVAWLPGERRFAFVAGRFVWEQCLDVTLPPGRAEITAYYRRNFGVAFETVQSVKQRGVDPADRGRVLELLAITAERRDAASVVDLVFAGGAGVRLEAERIFALGQDLGEPWPTRWRPRHPGVETA